MQWPFWWFIDILLLAFMDNRRVEAWEAGMGWMEVDSNGNAIPSRYLVVLIIRFKL